MTKQEIIEEIADRTGLTRPEALVAFEAALRIMSEAFVKKDDIFIRGFGTFKYSVTKPRTGRNISKGEALPIPATPTVKFKISKMLKEKLS